MRVRQRVLVALLAAVPAACASAPPSGVEPTPGASLSLVTRSPAATHVSSSAPMGASPGPCAPSTFPAGRMAFTVSDGRANGIGVVDSDGTDYRLLVEPRYLEGQPHGGAEAPTWAGADRILYSSNHGGGPDDWHIFSVGGAGGEPIPVTGGGDAIEYHPDLSADGRTLVYGKALATGDAAEPFADAGIFVADADGRNERQLTDAPAGAADEWPAISPDGSLVAFNRAKVAEGGLMVVNLDGTGLRTVVPSSLQPIHPRWSSDGARLTFSSNADRFKETSANVWVVDSDGSEMQQITFAGGGGQAWYPGWSPDDAFILFAHLIPGRTSTDLAAVPSGGGAVCTVWKGPASGGAIDSDWGRPSPR